MKSGMTPGKFLAFLLALGLLMFAAGCAAYSQYAYAMVLGLGGIVLGGWVILDAFWERHIDELDSKRSLTDSRTRFTTAVAAADPQTRRLLGREWLELGVEFETEPMFYLLKEGMNTGVLLACLQQFLRDSTDTHFVDVRNYNESKYLQDRFSLPRDVVRTQWHKAVEGPLREYLVPESMGGSSTWKWKSKESYHRAIRKYVPATIYANLGIEQTTEGEG